MTTEGRGEHKTEHIIVQDNNLNPAVLNYRLVELEGDVKALSSLITTFVNSHPTKEIIDLMILPLSAQVEELKKELHRDKEERRQQSNQLRNVLIGAVLSPVFSVFIAYLVSRN